MKLGTLQQSSTEEIRQSFNKAFEEYFVPIYLSAEQMAQKLMVEGYDASISPAVFSAHKPAGFILHGAGTYRGIPTAYNSGTGVLPAYRGQHLVQAMYEYILPILKERGFQKSLLEVIQENIKAKRCYEAVGFRVVRELLSYKAQVAQPLLHKDVQEIKTPNWPLLASYWNREPSWQHSLQCLQRASDSYKIWGIFKDSELVAYAVINPLTNRVPSFAVAPAWRNQKNATKLFQHLQQLYSSMPLTVINVDGQDDISNGFLKSLGLTPLVAQFEMELPI